MQEKQETEKDTKIQRERDNTEIHSEVDKDGWRKRLNKDSVEIGKKLEKE